MAAPTPEQLGPLAGLAGTWEGSQGVDVSFHNADGEIGDTPFREKVTLAGPLCTSIDLLARDLDISQAGMGDVLSVGLSGAYGPSASPNGFISQPGVREMIWDGLTLTDETPGETQEMVSQTGTGS